MKTITRDKTTSSSFRRKPESSQWVRITAMVVASAFLFINTVSPIAAAASKKEYSYYMLRARSGNMVEESRPQNLTNKVEQITSASLGKIQVKKPLIQNAIYRKYLTLLLSQLQKIATQSVTFVKGLLTNPKKELRYHHGSAFHEGVIDEEFEDEVEFAIKYAVTTKNAYYFEKSQVNRLGDIKIEKLDWSKRDDEQYPFKLKENPWFKLNRALNLMAKPLQKILADDNTSLVLIRLKKDVNYPLAFKLYKLVHRGEEGKEEFLNILKDQNSSKEAWNALYDLVKFLKAQSMLVEYVIGTDNDPIKNANDRLNRIRLWISTDKEIEEYDEFEKNHIKENMQNYGRLDTAAPEFMIPYMEKILQDMGENPWDRSSRVISQEQLKFLKYVSQHQWQLARVGYERNTLYIPEDSWNSVNDLELAQLLAHEVVHLVWAKEWKDVSRKIETNPVENGTSTFLANVARDKENLLENTINRESLFSLVKGLGYRAGDSNFWDSIAFRDISLEEAIEMVRLIKELLERHNAKHTRKELDIHILQASEASAKHMEERVLYYFKSSNPSLTAISLRDHLKSIALGIDAAMMIEEVSNKEIVKEEPSVLETAPLAEDSNLDKKDRSIGIGVEDDLAKFMLKYHIATGRAYYVWNHAEPKNGDIIIPTAEDVKVARDMEDVEKFINDALGYLEKREDIKDVVLKEIEGKVKQSNIIVIRTDNDSMYDYRIAWKLDKYLKEGNSINFIKRMASNTADKEPNVPWKALGLSQSMYQGLLRASYQDNADTLVETVRQNIFIIMFWLATNRHKGDVFTTFANIEITQMIRTLEGFRLGQLHSQLTLENSDTPDKIRALAPNYDEFNFAPWLKERMTSESYEEEKRIFYDVIFPSIVEKWRKKLKEKLEGGAQQSASFQQESSVLSPKTKLPFLLYHDFRGDPIWLALRSSNSRPNTLYLSEGLWEEVKRNPLALLQLLGIGVYGEEAEEIIFNQFKIKMGEQAGEYETLREILNRAHSQISWTKKEGLKSEWIAGSEGEMGEDISESAIEEARKRFGKMFGEEGNSFYDKEISWFPMVGLYDVLLKRQYGVIRDLIEEAGMIVVKAWGYYSQIREVMKALGIKNVGVEIVKGIPAGMNPADFNKFIAWSVDENGKLRILIHEMELKRVPQRKLKEFLAMVISHEYLEYLGMEHNEVVKHGFGEKDLITMYHSGLPSIADKFRTIRATYLTSDREYGHKSIAAELENWMEDEKEKTHTLLVPQFLLPTILPIAQRMVEEGKKVELVNVSGKGWGNISNDNLGNVKTVQINFIHGKFSLKAIQTEHPELFKDRLVLAVGQGLWNDVDLIKEFAISVLTIEFKAGSPMYKFMQGILKRSGMNEKDIKFLLDRLSKPIPLESLEKLAIQEHEIKQVSVSQ